MQKVTFACVRWPFLAVVRENRASSSVNVFGAGSRNAPELRWKRRFADVDFRILRYLRGASDFECWEDLRAVRVSCCVLESFKGTRCADRKKRCIVSLDVLGKLQIHNLSRASLVCAGGRLHREEAPARK